MMQKKFLRLAFPNIIANLSIPLLGIVDTAMMGHLKNIQYLGAIAIGGMIFNFIYWGFGFLRMGTTGLTAQAFGKNKVTLPKYILVRALLVACTFAFFIITLQIPIAKLSFYLINSSQKIEALAQSYFDIRIYAAPATLMLYAFHGWFLGMQNARYPLYLSVFSNLTNIGLNFLFIIYLKMNSNGIALGTLIAQYSTLLLAIYFMNKKYSKHFREIKFDLLIKADEIRKFFSINSDIFIRTLCLIFVFSFFTAKSAEFSDNMLAVNTILLQFIMILSYGIDGFAFAAESLIGKYMGAGKKEQVMQSIQISFRWSILLSLLVAIIFYFESSLLLTLFTNNESLIQLSLIYFFWVVIASLINPFCFIWDGIYIGATATKVMRNSMILSTIIFLSVFYLSYNTLGNHALWLAMTVFMASRGIQLTLNRKTIFSKL